MTKDGWFSIVKNGGNLSPQIKELFGKVVVFMKNSSGNGANNSSSIDVPLPHSWRIKITTEGENCYGRNSGIKRDSGIT